MKILIEINADNDAFAGGNMSDEVERIINEQIINQVNYLALIVQNKSKPLKDVNGNTVGFVKGVGDDV